MQMPSRHERIHLASLMRWQPMPVSEPHGEDGAGMLSISRKENLRTLLMEDPGKPELGYKPAIQPLSIPIYENCN